MSFSDTEREASEDHLQLNRIQVDNLNKIYEDSKIEGIMGSKMEAAIKMLKKKIPIEEIMEFTELSKDMIESLIEKT